VTRTRCKPNRTWTDANKKEMMADKLTEKMTSITVEWKKKIHVTRL